ncbi:hypothetical protein [Pseudomonas putida]|nr:hypothetical protein [Pseudomonas putida]
MSGRGLVIARRPWRLAASGGLPWAGLQLRLMTLPCISIQLQIPGGKGRYSVRKDFCSFDGKSLIDDFSNVEFKRGEFQDDQLRFEIALTPLGTKEIEIKICQVNFKDGQPEELTCQLSYG